MRHGGRIYYHPKDKRNDRRSGARIMHDRLSPYADNEAASVLAHGVCLQLGRTWAALTHARAMAEERERQARDMAA
jgi:hypothetical protein